ncbi:hypothetical protein P691DRAFT_671192 [Macrolepiota fuliginosa MF-IS2]|uniref:Nephrocystin 3-like N-terminal domain-containing protein n=1 Tax=Macrolepiota fuliginosa MF-IS2 TaxID=1400762 RepID=A0A9P5XAR2_9AGAR|nr:hypothetical protein P691DRAFT_671192 [Macrolepiota fuliginosa MF-IS2]
MLIELPLVSWTNLFAVQGRPRRNRAGFFQNAQQFVVNSPNMVDGIQHVHINDHFDHVLEWLGQHVMPGAEFDSAERDPPPHCHPGTRTSVLGRMEGWTTDPKREKNLFWLRGPAGVGKSAVIQSLVERCALGKRLGASLFFSRTSGRTNPNQVLSTLAYQFAVRDPEYKDYATKLVLADPRLFEKSMSEQFRLFVVEPFASRAIRGGTMAWVIALDGLDECDGEQQSEATRTRQQRKSNQGRSNLSDLTGRRGDEAQCEIVRLISGFVLQYPTVPLIWVIASRPEPHLNAVFGRDDVKDSFQEEVLPVDSDEACRDIELFLHHEFDEIRQSYPDHIPAAPWPRHDQFLKIATSTSGLFVFAHVLTRFISDSYVGNPVEQLDCVLTVISNFQLASDQLNPFAILDALYLQIMNRISPNMLQVTKRIIGSSIILGDWSPIAAKYGVRCSCNFFGITRATAITALRHLHSVLRISHGKEPTSVEFYHSSFREFLLNAVRSKDYWIDRGRVGRELFLAVFRFKKPLLARKFIDVLYTGYLKNINLKQTLGARDKNLHRPSMDFRSLGPGYKTQQNFLLRSERLWTRLGKI